MVITMLAFFLSGIKYTSFAYLIDSLKDLIISPHFDYIMVISYNR